MRYLLLLAAAALLPGQTPYTLLIKGGHVIDPKNGRSAKLDVAIQGSRIAKVAPNIPASQAAKVANAEGLYVVPGLIDIHAHVYAGTGVKALTGVSLTYWFIMPTAFIAAALAFIAASAYLDKK